MKNFSKRFLTPNNLFLFLIFVIAASTRFYNFPNRITFWTEQARSLIVSANYIKEKPSLLGQEYFRQDSNSHTIYSGALFNYSLVPLLLLLKYDPTKITVYFALLNIFTGLTLYMVAKKTFGFKVAEVALILFLFNNYMIYHSLFIWNYNYLPLVGILTFYFFWKYLKWHRKPDLLLIGLLCGIGVSLQLLFIPFAVLVFLLVVWKTKRKILGIFILLLSLSIANLPTILFDIRHNFYETRTLVTYFLDTIHGKSDAGFAYYYFLPVWPIFFIFAAWVIHQIIKFNRLAGFSLILIYIILSLSSQKISFVKPTGMPEGITVNDIDMAAKLIAEDASTNFNVAEVLDFDKRAYMLRYFTEFKYGKKPQGDTEYQNLKTLYVLSQKEYNFMGSDIWEVYAGGKYNVSEMANVGYGYGLYKLSK